MAARIAMVGAGPVASALARRWHDHGFRLVGFLARNRASAEAAVRFCGGGAVLAYGDLATATVVAVAVPDGAVGSVVAAAVDAGAVRRCALWLHTSGRLPVSVLAPIAAAGGRIGALHPLGPFPSAAVGHALLPDLAAALAGPPPSRRLLVVLARAAGMQPLALAEIDRELYHAACALAANGSTVLQHLAEVLLRAAAPADHAKVPQIVASLLRGAAGACRAAGAAAALTGPAARGDAAVVSAQRQRVAEVGGGAAAQVYGALAAAAADLARQRGSLAAARAAAVRQAALGSGDGANGGG